MHLNQRTSGLGRQIYPAEVHEMAPLQNHHEFNGTKLLKKRNARVVSGNVA